MRVLTPAQQSDPVPQQVTKVVIPVASISIGSWSLRKITVMITLKSLWADYQLSFMIFISKDHISCPHQNSNLCWCEELFLQSNMKTMQ